MLASEPVSFTGTVEVASGMSKSDLAPSHVSIRAAVLVLDLALLSPAFTASLTHSSLVSDITSHNRPPPYLQIP
jgi:hypothetical protein